MALTQTKIQTFLAEYDTKILEINAKIKDLELQKSKIEVKLLDAHADKKKLKIKFEAYTE